MATKPLLATSQLFTFPQAAPASVWATSASILLVDLIACSTVYWLSVIGRYLAGPGYQLTFYLGLFPCVGLLLLGFVLQGLYPGTLIHPAEEIRRVFYSVTTVFLLIGSATFLWHNAEAFSRSIVLVSWIACAPAVLLARSLARRMLSSKPWWGVPAVVLGSGPAAQRVVHTLRDTRLGVRVAGIFTEGRLSTADPDLPPVLGDLASASQLAGSQYAHYAIVVMPHKSNIELRYAIEDYCRGFRHILLVPDMPGLCSIGVCAREIGGEFGLEVPQRLFHRSAGLLKRVLDIMVSTLALLLLSPLFLLIAVITKLTSRGPVFYGHLRYGREGKIFKALKFRTMVVNADEVLAGYLQKHPGYSLEWQRDHKLKNDPRVTKIGKWLRRLSLDELPQLLNVLAGEMSLVGPRPIVKAEISKYGRGFDLYTRVLPGITGLWQISGRNNTTYEERVAFDEYYVRNWSIWLDTYILVRTISVVLTGYGAY